MTGKKIARKYTSFSRAVLYYIVLYCDVLRYSTVCAVLYCTVMYTTLLYSTLLYIIRFPFYSVLLVPFTHQRAI